ncbi:MULTISPECIES: hypothetical protein [Rhizobium]|uniref:hypothetical protein n=1 Tax=Rhizobium TaxID=379 RepID=UPI001C83FFD0|nr:MULTISPECIES: hypothetical protein [Rhizobium]MBX4952114.1 hypothetical protein [Rhizobium binae]MBX5238215.1 hypothetical protein [Rhizobium sp. NLR22b]MBX5276137.1 hypothetical protein [Rhizobium sp. NLR13a]MBX5305380.1 hypothetical protein [Rhizobium sp. NLR14b]
MAKLTFKEAVKLELETIRSVQGRVTQDAVEATMARFVLKEDLCELKNDWPTSYGLDEDTRDRLIAHARQDAALAYYSSSNAKKEVKRLRFLVWALGLVNLGFLIYLTTR